MLCDEMGLGKTTTSLFAVFKRQQFPVLIFVPNIGLGLQWWNEIKNSTSPLPKVIIMASRTLDQTQKNDLQLAHIVIAPYSVLHSKAGPGLVTYTNTFNS